MALDLTYDPNQGADTGGELDFTYDAGAAKPKKQNKGIIGDIGTGLKRGVEQMPGMVTGIADIAAAPVSAITGINRPFSRAADYVGEKTGFQPSKWAEQAAQEYSPEMQQSLKAVEQADGFTGTLKAIGENPRSAVNLIAESLPSTLAGGILARGAMGAVVGAEKLAAMKAAGDTAGLMKAGAIAGGIGEGAVTAGQQMSQTDYNVDPLRAAGAATAAGIGTGIIGGISGRVANKLGMADIEGSIAAGTLGAGKKAGAGAYAGRIAGGAVQEGALEEMPQSAQEQVWQNVANSKPWDEGVGKASAQGLVAGMAMGAGVNALPGSKRGDVLPADSAAAKDLNQSLGGDVAATPTLVTDIDPMHADLINRIIGVGAGPMDDKQRAQYEKDLAFALDPASPSETVGYTTDANGIEIPFTMRDYVASTVRVADMTRDQPKAARANVLSADRLAELGAEESTQQPDIAPGYVPPVIPVVGPLSAIANAAVQSGAHQTAVMQQAATEQAKAKPAGPLSDAANQSSQEVANENESFVQRDAGSVQRIAAGGGAENIGLGQQNDVRNSGIAPVKQSASQIAPSTAGAFDVSGKNLLQLKHLAAKGQPGWKEAATAELARRNSATAEQSSDVQPASADPALQNRDRGRAASVNQMQSIARNPDYMRLGPSRTPDSGAPMVFAVGNDTQKISPANFGANDTAVMSDGQRVPFRYAVVDASSVEPSNFADGATNPAFASNAPGTIKALNNGRTAGVRSAHSSGNATTYTAELLADQAHGVSPEAIRNTPNPMLVRVYAEQSNTGDMAAKSQGHGLGMSASERATQDAELMTADVLDKFAPGDIASAGNRDFVRAFVGKLAENELADMMDATGNLSQDGRRRIEAALLTAAYGKSDLVQELFESTDTDIKAIGNALKVMSGQWAAMRQAAKEGSIDPATDMTANLIEAVNIVRRSRAEGSSIAELAGQGDLMGGNYLSELSEGFLRIFYKGKSYDRARGGDKVIAALQEIVTSAMNTKAEAGLFGDSFKATPKQIVESARSKIDEENKPASQSSLFGANGQATAVSQGNNGEGAAQSGEVGQGYIGTGRSEDTGKQAEPVAKAAEQAPAVNAKGNDSDSLSREMAGFTGVSDAEYALRQLSHKEKQEGDIELGNGKFVTLEQAVEAAKKSMDPADWSKPFQFNRVLDIAPIDWNTMVGAMKNATVDAKKQEEAKPSANEPWQMTRKEWYDAKNNDRAETFGSSGKRNGAAETAARIERKARLNYGVAENGEPVDHRQVIEKAIADGKQIPDEVLADYPDLKESGIALLSPSLGRVDANKVDIAVASKVVADLLSGWRNAPDSRVVATFDDLPAAVRKEIEDQGEKTARGVFHGDTFYLIADEHASANEIEETIFHEVWAHYGLRSMLGANTTRELAGVFDQISASGIMGVNGKDAFRAFARRNGFNTAQTESMLRKAEAFDPRFTEAMKKRILVEELIAKVQEKGDSPSLKRKAQEIIGAIREWLRKVGFSGLMKYSDADLMRLVQKARDTVKYGKRGSSGKGDVPSVLMTAWHGSPHDHDKFDSSKIGTGEGAQAYGHGLYFAGERSVAEYYRNAGSSAARLALDALNRSGGIAKEAIKELKKWDGGRNQSDFLDAISLLKTGNQNGRLYQVELAPSEDEYLDWDKPLSEQSDTVKAALDKVGLPKKYHSENKTGSEIYRLLSQDSASHITGKLMDGRGDKAASEYLHSLGIRGIRYLDGSSRSKGEGNSNYVIFSDDDVTITAKYNLADKSNLSPADKAIYGMAAEGKSAAEILKFIASASRNPFNRQVARLLLKTGIAPSITVGDSKTWNIRDAKSGEAFAAAYDPKTNTVALFRPASAERNALHELIHAASLKALAKNGLASAQMKALFAHVEKTGKLTGMYGIRNVDEFIAEAFSNPKFQAALKQVSAAPVGGKPSSEWDWFIRVVRGILGLKQGADNALSQALDIGVGVMRENMALQSGDGVIRFNHALRSTPEGNRPLNAIRLAKLRRIAAGLERPKDAVFLRVTEDGKAITTGPKGVRIPETFIRFAESNGLDFEARRNGEGRKSDGHTIGEHITSKTEAMPTEYRESGALYFGEGNEFFDRTGKTRYNQDDTRTKQTDTAAFRKWFGSSAVVDANGEPLVVYHGAPDVRGIFANGFEARNRGGVFFAAADYGVANSYALDHRAYDYQNAEPQTIPLYLSIKNPMIVDAKGANWKETERHVQEAKDAGYDGIIIKNSVDYYNNQKTKGKTTTVYAWFAPTQAKSAVEGNLNSRVDLSHMGQGRTRPIPGATGNNGDFDGTNPDIRYNIAGTQAPTSAGDGSMGSATIPSPEIPRKLSQKQFEGILQDIDGYGPIEADDPYRTQEFRSIIKRLKTAGIDYIDMYHVTDAGIQDFNIDGIRSSSVDYIGRAGENARASSVYGFLDPDDIEKSYDGILGAESETPNVIHIKVPVENIGDFRWDSNFNLTYGAYSGIRFVGNIPSKWISGAYPYNFQNEPSASAGSDAIRYNAAPGKINQTDTAAFKRWFGDSKVVDADGKPMRVYHGTGATDIGAFNVSDRGSYGGGIYLTPEIRGANDYAIYRGAPSSTVYPVYAAIKNPASGSEAAQVASWKGEENAREELIRRGYDGVVDMRSGEIVAFYPSQVKSAIGNNGDFDGGNPDIRYNVADEGKGDVPSVLMTAWHGSPHNHDKFDSSKIGTGEGAQAYGHGLYFAGARSVAEWYRNALSKRNSGNSLNDRMAAITIDGKPVMDFGIDMDSELADMAAEGDLFGAYFHANKRADRWDEFASDESYQFKDYAKEKSGAWRNLESALETAKEFRSSEKGRLYQVELAPSEDEYLDWDKPLSEQSELVRDALSNASFEYPISNDTKGEDIYLHASLDSSRGFENTGYKAASDYLHSIGIRGIRYLDGSSRDQSGTKWKDGVDPSKYDKMAKGVAENYLRERGNVSEAIKRLKADALASKAKQYSDAAAALESGDLVQDLNHNFVIFNDADVSITAKYNKAGKDKLTPADKAIYGMAAEGKSAAEVLKFIASASRSPFNRQVAKLLLKTGIAPNITVGDGKGWKMNAGDGNKYAAAYNPKSDTVSLFRPASAERNMLHELIHAATLKALSKKGMASAQMNALYRHVKKSGKLKGMYGMSDVDEFIAESFSNPKFQAMLKQVSAAPVGGKPSSAWDWFVRVIRGILGLKQGQDNALSQALDIGIGVMRENMGLNEAPKNANVRGMADKDNVAGTQAPTSAGDGSTGSDTVLYTGSAETISEIKNRGSYGGLFASASKDSALSHGDVLHEIRLNSSEIMSQSAMEEVTDEQLLKAAPWVSPDDVDQLRELVVDDRMASDDDVALMRVEDVAEASIEGQRLRGAVAKSLGYKAVEMNDEHGTSYLVLPGTKIYPNEPSASAGSDAIRYNAAPGKINQTDTAAFKKWFSGSKVVDTDGKPLVVYHGTRHSFDEFMREGRKGRDRLHYFTEDPAVASEYAGDVRHGTPNVMPVYVSLQKPFVFNASGEQWGSLPLDIFPDEISKHFDERNILRGRSGQIPRIGFAEVIRGALVAGYDGVVADNITDGGGKYGENHPSKVVVAHAPEQIKSAIGNNGDFDPSNPDIRYNVADDGGDIGKIVGDSGRQYDQSQRQFFKNVGRDVSPKGLFERTKEYLQNDFWKKMAVGIVDQFRGLRDLNDNGQAYMLARLSKGTAGAFETLLHHGKLSIKDGVYDGDQSGGFIEKLGVPLQGELDDFLWWVAANRAEGLAKNERENLFTPADIAAGKSLASGETAFDYTIQTGLGKGRTTRSRSVMFADAQRVFNEFQKNSLDIAEQSGLIDGAARKFWESEFYVPFYRVSEEDGEFIGAKMGQSLVRQQAFKKLKGGTDKLNSDLLSNTLLNWSHLIEASAKNRAAKAALVGAENVGAAQRVAGTMAEYAASNGAMLPPGTKQTVWFQENGQKVEYLVTDPFVMTAITSLEYAGLRSPMWNVLTTFKHWLTIGVTASPAFKVRNLIRDSIQAIGTSDLGYNPITNIKEGFKASARDKQEYVSALASGGLIRFGTMLEGSESSRVRQLIKSGVKDSSILDSEPKWRQFYDKFLEPGISAYNELGNRSEEITRAALYNQLIKQGKSHAEAALMARDLMDFSMHGSFVGIRILTQIVPFMNARLQGMYKLGRSAKDNPRKLAIVTGAVAMASIALMLGYEDDDDWKRREDWDRDNFWWFKFGGIEYRIPKPFEVGAVGTLAERSVEYLINDEMTGERFRKVASDLVLHNLSMNPIPQAFKPIVDLYANKDSFTGRPIETMSMQRLDPTMRYNSNTSLVARGLSTATGGLASPVQYDHMARAYFGWLGAFVIGGADMIARPMTNEPEKPERDYWKFATQGILKEQGSGNSRYLTMVYDQAHELEQAHATHRQMIKEGKIDDAREYAEDNAEKLKRYRMVEQVKRTEAKFNENIRAIERGDLDPEEKKLRIERIQQMKENVAKRIAPGIQ